jgi:hypothetical protein
MKDPKFKMEQNVFIAINPSYVSSEEAIIDGYVEGYKSKVMYNEDDVEYDYKICIGMDSTWIKEKEIFLTKEAATKEAFKKVNSDIDELKNKLDRYEKIKSQLSQIDSTKFNTDDNKCDYE